MTKTNTSATVKRELTKDELEKLGRHAGHLAREIDLKTVARKDAADKAKVEIGELISELADTHDKLHNGFEWIPAQMELIKPEPDEDDELEMPPADSVTRLDECRAVVEQAKKDVAQEENEDEQCYQRAVNLISMEPNGSGAKITVSVLRRKLRVGKNRASRVMERLVAEGLLDAE